MIVDSERDGKKYKMLVPDGAPVENWKYGIPVGPPDLSALGLPLEIEVRLHNELYVRGIITKNEARKRIRDIAAALMATLSVDAQTILALYEGS